MRKTNWDSNSLVVPVTENWSENNQTWGQRAEPMHTQTVGTE